MPKKYNKEHNEKTTSKSIRKRKDKTVSSLHTSLLCLILSGTLLTLFVVYYTDQIPWYIGHRAVDSIANKFGYHKPVHAVVIDAGSTGSRVLAFTFHESYFGQHLILDKELFAYSKPGLSSFANNPEKGVATIANLIEKAKKEIPKQYWSQTPLILKATAGLRMLPPEKANKLLDSVREYFKKVAFQTNEKSVEIMEGTDEGIFSWFTVNFLLERIGGDPSRTVAALDLGGGSTQTTFAATTPASLKDTEHIHRAQSPRGLIQVYTRSMEGLGLMAARYAVITGHGNGGNLNVTSECVNPVVRGKKFHYSGTDYYISGLQENYPKSHVKGSDIEIGEDVPIVSFSNCSEIIVKYVKSKAHAPEELPLKTIVAFSYYYDRAAEAGLIDESTGGQIKVKDFRTAAEKVCHDANADQPFMCFDLTFIWALLEKGFNLNENTKIYLYKKINGHETSWALGAAYNMLRG
ncbi:unnamed protein product [Acanthoscelides obtectus]|uniref:Ectonucleoside triphosphate diphosphohydrolase 5 n=2 Tax=Acanthoscelides obtectus TaxID=200917 RepID=A0A9P0K784_ACAOB|nr:unnamed protein product [Acanthoscelides obtectus]CAK1665875.1 Ectonucleoside triphosphate diphosphohydrolase 5 [Acanthoscelides obtectus]